MRFILCVLIGLVTAVVIKAEDKPPSPAESAIRTVLHDQVTAWNKGDLATFMAGYWKSPDLTFYAGKDTYQGWDKAFERYQKRYQTEGREMGRLTFSELQVQVLSPEFAVVKGHWNVETKKETLKGLFTLVMKKTDKGWVIVHDHTSM